MGQHERLIPPVRLINKRAESSARRSFYKAPARSFDHSPKGCQRPGTATDSSLECLGPQLCRHACGSAALEFLRTAGLRHTLSTQKALPRFHRGSWIPKRKGTTRSLKEARFVAHPPRRFYVSSVTILAKRWGRCFEMGWYGRGYLVIP